MSSRALAVSMVAAHFVSWNEAFVTRHWSHPRLGLQQLGMVNSREIEISTAFERVKDAALLFPEGSAERLTADNIIDKLSKSHFESWKADDMELLDSCLMDDDQPACVSFVAAMTDLRELHESSPGNA